MNMLEAFTGGNPFHTPVGQRIEKATDGSLPSENWALNIEICDIINETDEGPKEAIRAIRKKVNSCMSKDWRAITYCLVVLETCVKNCGKRFHMQVAHKDFLNDLVKIILPKNEPPVVVQEKFLFLIQSWANAFRGVPELKAVESVYQDLKHKGIEFPAAEVDQMSPIHTPQGNADSPIRISSMTTPTSNQPARAGKYSKLEDDGVDDEMPIAGHPTTVPGGGSIPPAMPARAPQQPTPEQMSKLRNDIDIVQGNCRVFNEMLNIAPPGSPELTAETTELLRELNRTCRQMQQRIVILLEQLADEQVTEVLLRVNDDLNNAFLRYDRVERFLSMSAAPTAAATSPAIAAVTPQTALPVSTTPAADQSLIDFGSSEPTPPPRVSASALAAHVDSMNLSPTPNIASIGDIPSSNVHSRAETDEFDMLAQSRQTPASGSMGVATSGPADSQTSEPSVTSSEFDQFLEARLTAAERLPDITTSNGRSRSPVAPTRGGARQMNKDDSENALFAI